MDIAALSTGMSLSRVKQDAGISVMKIAIDTGKENGTKMTEMIQNTEIDTNVGQNLDTWA